MGVPTYTNQFYLQVPGLEFSLSQGYIVEEMPLPLEVSDGSGELVLSSEGSSFGILGHRSNIILGVLRKEITVQLFADCAPIQFNGSTNSKPRVPKNIPKLELCAVLYGPAMLSDSVGKFLSRCHIYLQDPKNCSLNAPYCNPQSLSREDCRKIYTFDLGKCSDTDSLGFGISANPIDLFTDSTMQDVLADSKTPCSLSTELYPHQKQALTFMTQRERGWALDRHYKDIWKREQDEQGRTWYKNYITGLKQTKAPRPFRGGLLIDAPGLGKSLSILALIALNLESRGQHISESGSSGTTLVIVPKSRKSEQSVKHS